MAKNNVDVELLAGLSIDSSEAEILKAIKIIEKRLKANTNAKIKLNTDIDETVIRNTVEKLQNILKGKELKIETKSSIEAITKEVNAMGDIVTVAKFRGYWLAKITQWFSPQRLSPFAFYKTVGQKAIGKFIEACDGLFQKISNLFRKYEPDGSLPENAVGMTDWNQSDEPNELKDKWSWDGWWQQRNVFDITLYDEMATLYGSWEEDQYEASKEFWKSETSGEASLEFPIIGTAGQILSEAEIEELSNGRQRIIVTSLPYVVNKAKLIENIANLKNKEEIHKKATELANFIEEKLK